MDPRQPTNFAKAAVQLLAAGLVLLIILLLATLAVSHSSPADASEIGDHTWSPNTQLDLDFPPPEPLDPSAYNGGHHATFFKLPKPHLLHAQPGTCITGLASPKDVRDAMTMADAHLQSQTRNGPATYQTWHRPALNISLLFVFLADYEGSGHELGCLVAKFGTPTSEGDRT